MTAPAPEDVDLLGVVAYGELSAFTRLAADADRAPDLAGRAELAALAAVEMEHYGRIRDHLAARGVDVLAAMAPFVAPLDAFHRAVVPYDWAESLVTAHLGRGLVADLQDEVVSRLGGPEGDLVREVLADAGHAGFVERAVRDACDDERTRGRLALAARRLLGEALVAAAAVLDEHSRLAAVLVDGPDTAPSGGRAAVFKRLKVRHSRRVTALGL